MTILKDTEIAALALKYFGADKATVATSLVWPESSGDPNAVNPRSGATGLWQVMPPPTHPWATGNLKDPAYNAAAAARIQREEGWTAWSTYGANTAYLLRANAAVRTVAGSPPLFSALLSKFGVSVGGTGGLPPIPFISPDSPISVFDAPKAIAEGLAFLTSKHNWQRVAMFVGGGALLIVGVVGTLSKSGAGRQVVNAIPAGKAIRAVT